MEDVVPGIMVGFMGLALTAVVFFFYLIPTMVAMGNKEASQKWAAIVINVIFGWTLIGWIAALILALQKRQTVVVQQVVQHVPTPAAAPAPEANASK